MRSIPSLLLAFPLSLSIPIRMTTLEMTEAALAASGGNRNAGERETAASDPVVEATAGAAAAVADIDVDEGAQREPRQERSPPVAGAGAGAAPGSQGRDEIFTWEAPHATYALGWSVSIISFSKGGG